MSSRISFITIILYSFHAVQHALQQGYLAANGSRTASDGMSFLHFVQVMAITMFGQHDKFILLDRVMGNRMHGQTSLMSVLGALHIGMHGVEATVCRRWAIFAV